ncbi:MAG: hypothetical protein WCL02_07790 [bacterium]
MGVVYCIAGVVVNPERFCVGELVGITPNKIKNQIIINTNPEMTNQFFVPHKFLSNHAMFPVSSAKNPEKYTIDQPSHAITNPMIICLAIVFSEELSSG